MGGTRNTQDSAEIHEPRYELIDQVPNDWCECCFLLCTCKVRFGVVYRKDEAVGPGAYRKMDRIVAVCTSHDAAVAALRLFTMGAARPLLARTEKYR